MVQNDRIDADRPCIGYLLVIRRSAIDRHKEETPSAWKRSIPAAIQTYPS